MLGTGLPLNRRVCAALNAAVILMHFAVLVAHGWVFELTAITLGSSGAVMSVSLGLVPAHRVDLLLVCL